MTSSQPGVQISKKAFIQAAVIILALMLLSGVLTRVLLAGQFAREVVEGRGDVIQPDSF